MAIFRKKCDSVAALALLRAIVVPPTSADERLASAVSGLANAERVRREFSPLRLFAVLAATKESRHQEWQAQGPELFDALFETTLQTIMSEHQESEVLARLWLAERVQYYALSQHMVASIDQLGTEVGNGFGMLFADPPSDALSRLGRGVFFRAFEQTLARHADFKLVKAAT
jgi:hypothetical protein